MSTSSPQDSNTPPDSPFVLVPPESTEPLRDLSSEYPPHIVRMLEDHQRRAERHRHKLQYYKEAEKHWKMYLTGQAAWCVCGTYFIYRGVQYSDPLKSIIRPLTENSLLCRLASLPSLTGLAIVGVTLYQFPRDYASFKDASAAVAQEQAFVDEQMDQQQQKMKAFKEKGSTDGATKN